MYVGFVMHEQIDSHENDKIVVFQNQDTLGTLRNSNEITHTIPLKKPKYVKSSQSRGSSILMLPILYILSF